MKHLMSLFLPKKQELIENKKYITLLMDLFEAECRDSVLEFHLFIIEL